MVLLTPGLLPQEFVDELLQLPPPRLLDEPFGPLLLLLRVPDRTVPGFTAALDQCVRRGLTQPGVGGPSTSGAGFGVVTAEVPAVQRDPARDAEADHASLLAELDASTHYVFPLRPGAGPLGIGRSRDNALVLRDDSVSQLHAEIHVGADGVSVSDVDSKNGTWVGGTRLAPNTPRWLQPMDSLRFGRVQAFTCAPTVLRSVLRRRLRQLL